MSLAVLFAAPARALIAAALRHLRRSTRELRADVLGSASSTALTFMAEESPSFPSDEGALRQRHIADKPVVHLTASAANDCGLVVWVADCVSELM